MKIGLAFSLGTLAVAAALVPTQAQAAGDARVTTDNLGGSYTRYDGTTDATTTACGTGRRPQNEPSVAVNPRNPNIVVAGSNDYCGQTVGIDVWTGYYRSTDGGATWHNSLVPGYPTDESAAGTASPTHGVCNAAGDPTQAFDAEGRLFYGFICFNRAKPSNGSIYAATYDQDGGRYVRTVKVATGTPSTAGLFQDKVNLAVDPATGNVYIAWVRYSGAAGNNVVYFSRSLDHGATFSPGIRVSAGLSEEQFADLAVAPDGTVYLTYRTIAHQPSTHDAIHLVRSTDQGASFQTPRELAGITPFDSGQFGDSDSCGDGPFACASGFTYSRFSSLSAVAADASGVHVVWSARNAAGQAKVYVRNSPDGVNWPTPAKPLDGVPTGHQWFPDIASADGVITAVFYDSRRDPGYAPTVPPGNTAAGVNSGDVVDTIAARSGDGGVTWTESVISTAGSNFGWETHGARRLGFWGDYNYVSAVPGAVNAVWTDSRDLVPGVDPREPNATDGFDVYQPCTYVPNDINAPSYSSPSITDPCLNQGGLDQNIYGARL
jgi:hypothetical protein